MSQASLLKAHEPPGCFAQTKGEECKADLADCSFRTSPGEDVRERAGLSARKPTGGPPKAGRGGRHACQTCRCLKQRDPNASLRDCPGRTYLELTLSEGFKFKNSDKPKS